MRPWHAAVAFIAAGTLLGGALPASAETIPSDLEFDYTMSSPLIGNIQERAVADCNQSLGAPFDLQVGGNPMGLIEAINKPSNEILCTIVMERILSDVVITGTASASAQGQAGTGNFSLLCEVGQRRTSFFSIVVSPEGRPGYGPNPYGMGGNAHVSCTWTIAVDDEQKSQLAGTLETYGNFTQDSQRVTCEEAGITISDGGGGETFCVAFDLTVRAYLTGATGAYAGRSGEGSLIQRGYAAVTVPLKLTFDDSCPAPGPMAWMTPLNTDCEGELPPSDFDPSIPPCVPGEEGEVPPDGFSDCVVSGSSSSRAMVRALESVVRASTGGGLTLSTATKAGETRFVSPAQTSTDPVRAFGSTPSAQPSVRLATVPGAMCTVTAKAGKTSTKLASRMKAPNGQLNTKVTAPTLMSKLKATKGSQATITAACSVKVGKKTRKLPSASVTVRFS